MRPAGEPLAVGVVIPVRNEQAHLAAALRAVQEAGSGVRRSGVRRCVVAVVLDGCTDASRAIAEAFAASSGDLGVEVLVNHRALGAVGAARAAGVGSVLARLAGTPAQRIWLATTDADSAVPRCWLDHQLLRRREGVEAWAGPVAVADWDARPPGLAARFRHAYLAGGARHVHGTSLAFTADAYRLAGGFPPLRTGEDHALWNAFAAAGVVRRFDDACPVLTSARRDGRAPLGFASYLDRLEVRAPSAPVGKCEAS